MSNSFEADVTPDIDRVIDALNENLRLARARITELEAELEERRKPEIHVAMDDLIENLQERVDEPEVAPSSSTGRGGLCYVDRDVLLAVLGRLRRPEIHVAMGFLSQQGKTPQDRRLVPVYDPTNPGTEALFMTMPISLDLLDDERERERFAEFAARFLSEKFARLVRGWPDRGPL